MLKVADKLALPLDAQTQTFAVFGKRGSGKTTFGVVLAEEMYAAGLPFVVLDPQGVWWGLKSSGNGKSPGLSVYVFGGDHADVPLQPTGGALLADVVVEQRISAVLDLAQFSGRERSQFVTDFAEQLFRKNRQALHVFVEEADEFVPQRPFKGEERMLGAMEKLVKRGRSNGIGVTLITQRAASINKNVTTQAEVLVAYRILGPQDRDAIDQWIKYHQAGDMREEVLASLATLPTGTAWVWAPEWPPAKPIGLQQVAMRRRDTFDSSATPKPGEERAQPKKLADVDLDRLKERMAATIQQAKDNDPKELKKQLAETRRQLAAKAPPAADPHAAEQAVQRAVREAERQWAGTKKSLEGEVRRLQSKLAKIVALAAASEAGPIEPNLPKIEQIAREEPARPASPPIVRRERMTETNGDDKDILDSGKRRILTALAQYPEGRTKIQVAVLTGYAHSGGYFNRHLGTLRSHSFIEGEGHLRITQAGLDALGSYEPLPTGAELLRYWLDQLNQPERESLTVLVEAYPGTLTKEEVAARTPTGYQPTGGFFSRALGHLRTLELIQGKGAMRASEELF